ncbi:MAG: hypothetical protein CHACPFDD_00680 [Phycisphaerae bacterium]|nr:hypothetical protein [Phycisphaerae bacterium]
MSARPNDPQDGSEALHAFFERVWREDIAPLLDDHRRAQREKAARTAGRLAAGAGRLADGLLGLRGKPFTRFMTIMGSTLGAVLPDVWDWRWFRRADASQRRAVEEHVRGRVDQGELDEALALLGLDRRANADALRSAWRGLSQRWHPDKAPDDASRDEYRLRFVALQAAHDRVGAALERGELPAR